jgi:hypothetical protein
MFLTIPAKIKDGRIVPIAEMPASELIRRVALLVEVEDVQYKHQSTPSRLNKLRGILKENSDSDYVSYLENKYQ